ncbi:Lsr2 family protein [Jatrophihabitans telluris]|uniref:Lsr2 family protein n=1 Tax=Jatrophihabitans telluris TaxID=2038343 RepID=A0ABY4R1R7_9ACTN|nr:Lsr2 family protein [Jatrophihabitans telluris]
MDDIDGTEGDVSSVEFALEGVQYRIDLSEKNAEKLRKALASYIDSAEKIGGRRSAVRPVVVQSGKRSKEELQAIREWARSSGYAVSDRGRIPAEIEQAYAEAK